MGRFRNFGRRLCGVFFLPVKLPTLEGSPLTANDPLWVYYLVRLEKLLLLIYATEKVNIKLENVLFSNGVFFAENSISRNSPWNSSAAPTKSYYSRLT